MSWRLTDLEVAVLAFAMQKLSDRYSKETLEKAMGIELPYDVLNDLEERFSSATKANPPKAAKAKRG